MTVNLTDPAVFHGGVPHAEFDRLRSEAPVHWTPTSTGAATGGFWSLTRHDDIANAGRDTLTFTSTRGIRYPSAYNLPVSFRDNVIQNDPPRHTEIRRLVGAAFTPRMVARFSDWITDQVKVILDGLTGRGACDLVPLVAAELPAQVICSVMGVPDDKRRQVVQWADQIFSESRYEDGIQRSNAASQAVMEYALELRDQGWDVNNESMLGELATAERDGVKITDSMFMQLWFSLLIAGFETTHTLIGQSLRMILENPGIAEQARTAVAGGKVRELVDEFLRVITPAMHMARHATRDVELHGTTIREGDMVLLWYVAGNRDPSVFDEPHRFDYRRKPNTHQSFGGGGPHFCVGNHLARLEVQVLLQEMFSRDLKISLNGEPERGWSVFINQLFTLPAICE